MSNFKKRYIVIWKKGNVTVIFGYDRRFIAYWLCIIRGILKGYEIQYGEV